MPKETDEDKAARREAMQQALKEATKSPYGMMEDILAAPEFSRNLSSRWYDSSQGRAFGREKQSHLRSGL